MLQEPSLEKNQDGMYACKSVTEKQGSTIRGCLPTVSFVTVTSLDHGLFISKSEAIISASATSQI